MTSSEAPAGFFIFRPSDGINYDFVVNVYAAASVVFAALAVLDRFMKVPQVEGYWIIFSPFLPCLLWALVVRARWRTLRVLQTLKKSE